VVPTNGGNPHCFNRKCLSSNIHDVRVIAGSGDERSTST
jgi:hypothetical protein